MRWSARERGKESHLSMRSALASHQTCAATMELSPGGFRKHLHTAASEAAFKPVLTLSHWPKILLYAVIVVLWLMSSRVDRHGSQQAHWARAMPSMFSKQPHVVPQLTASSCPLNFAGWHSALDTVGMTGSWHMMKNRWRKIGAPSALVTWWGLALPTLLHTFSMLFLRELPSFCPTFPYSCACT